jgi:hypothetical protein
MFIQGFYVVTPLQAHMISLFDMLLLLDVVTS